MNPIMIAVDVIAILVLVFAIYLPRHRRKDLAVALLGVNVGVLAVATALVSSSVSAGLGLGLFGVLSIIRLRSDELKQTEIAYYFASLAIGLVGGLSAVSLPIGAGLICAIVLTLAIVDSPRLMRSSRHLSLTLDKALADVDDVKSYVADKTGLNVKEVSIVRLDYVNDLTIVDARCVARPER